MQRKLIKKCSAISTEQISISSCNTNYNFDGAATFSYEDLSGVEESSLLSQCHEEFKSRFKSLIEFPQQTEIIIGDFVFKTGNQYKRGFSRPQVTAIDYQIEATS